MIEIGGYAECLKEMKFGGSGKTDELNLFVSE